MLKTRIIPTLLYRDFGLVKGRRFDSLRAVGSATQAIKVYEMRGVDELMFLDVTATRQDRGPDLVLIDELADDCFMPLTVGGGVRDVDDVGALLAVGADKVCIGTVAVERPEIVREGSERYGSQCIVISIDAIRRDNGQVRVCTHSGTRETELDPVEFAVRLEELGAGEILLQSVDRDGMMEGYDLELIESVTRAVNVPVIASGGCGGYEDMLRALQGGASAVAAASIFHFTEQTPREAKDHLGRAGLPVRL